MKQKSITIKDNFQHHMSGLKRQISPVTLKQFFTVTEVSACHVRKPIQKQFGPKIRLLSSFKLSRTFSTGAMSLSSRLDRVLAQGSTESVENFRKLSVEEMGQHKVTFGKSHIGKTFAEMWESEKGWIRWFSKTYGDSQKDEHKKILAYIEAMVAQHEMIYEMDPLLVDAQEVIQPRAKVMPKSKAMPAMPASDMIPSSNVAEDPWDVMDIRTQSSVENQEIIDALQTRVLNMENAIGEILNHIRQSSRADP